MDNKKIYYIIDFIRKLYKNKDFIPLHEPVFFSNEKKYLNECINSTFVSTVGEYVKKAEEKISNITNSKYTILTNSGTSALHLALIACGVRENDEVITQSISFIATANAIRYCKANPIFLDIDKKTLSLSPKSLEEFLKNSTILKNNTLINKKTKNKIKAIVLMHTFGKSAKIKKIIKLAKKYNLKVIEDSAQAFGSKYKDKSLGIFGDIGIFSFNGNKIVTAGSGGAVVTNDKALFEKINNLANVAKIPHKFELLHSKIGYNYKMANINAAILLAQLEKFDNILQKKQNLSKIYKNFFKDLEIEYLDERKGEKSNFWLNTIKLNSKTERDLLANALFNNKIQTRFIYKPINEFDFYKSFQTDDLTTTNELKDKILTLPSSIYYE